MNNVRSFGFFSSEWGKDCAVKMVEENSGNNFDLVIMADVLYHFEDFSSLIETITGCCYSTTNVYSKSHDNLESKMLIRTEVLICFEQRRKNLWAFFEAMLAHNFVLYNAMLEYSVTGGPQNTKTVYYLYHFIKK